MRLILLLLGILYPPTPPLPTDVCASVTNYWPFAPDGTAIVFEGQADSDPTHTATMYQFSADDRNSFVASFDGFTDSASDYYGAQIKLTGFGVLPVKDRFGATGYRKGVFWHEGYQQYVFGVDVMTDTPLHYLDCNAEIIFKE